MKTPMIDLGTVQISVSDYASQGNAILGIRDSGKSYTATAIAEKLLTNNVPFVAFDPIGTWRFLRHAGKTHRGFAVIVAGGEEGDVPLRVDTAETIARHAMQKGFPLVLDLYDMALSKADWHRIVERVVRMLLYENKRHGPRHVFLEEAAEFVPQLVRSEHATVYAEIEKLARMGGNAMLGYTLINQRAEQVNKAVLELCDALILHRQKGRLSLTALSKWLDFGDKRQTSKIIQRMPLLEQGECYVWKGGSECPVFTKIPEKGTFHPNRREHVAPGDPVRIPAMLAGLELPDDPKGKKVRPAIVTSTPAGMALVEPEKIEVPVFRDGELAHLATIQSYLAGHLHELTGLVEDIGSAVKRSEILADKARRPIVKHEPKVSRQGDGTMRAGPRRILQVLASRHPLRLTFSQVSTIAVFTASTMRTYLPCLREQGLLDENQDGMGITQAGRDVIGTDYEAIPKGGEDLLRFWTRKLRGGEAKILTLLFEYGEHAATMDMIERDTDFTPSTIRTYIPTLRRNKLIHATELKISPEFL